MSIKNKKNSNFDSQSLVQEAERLLSVKKILIIVPAYNEEKNIYRTIEEISSANLPLSIVVINDGSTDRTKEEALRTKAHVISLPFNLGIGGAVQTGFKYAYENDFDIAVQIDADGQHDVSFLKVLLEPVLSGDLDMSIGSRFIPPYIGYKSSFVRRIGIQFFAYLISFMTQYRVTDPTSGFRAFNWKMIKVFAKYYPSDFPEPEAIVVAGRYGAKVAEVPVQMRKRLAGSSSIRYLKTLYYMIKVTVAILLDKVKHKPKNIHG